MTRAVRTKSRVKPIKVVYKEVNKDFDKRKLGLVYARIFLVAKQNVLTREAVGGGEQL